MYKKQVLVKKENRKLKRRTMHLQSNPICYFAYAVNKYV